MQICRGMCRPLIAQRLMSQSMYDISGWCRQCQVYIKNEHIVKYKCPCCTTRMRTSPRNSAEKCRRWKEKNMASLTMYGCVQ